MEKKGSRPAWLKTAALLALWLGFALLAGGCVTMKDPEVSQDFHADVVGVVQPGETFGQTFLARRTGLNGVQLWLQRAAGAPEQGGLTIDLYHTLSDPQPLTTFSISVAGLTNAGPVNLPLPPQFDPTPQPYTLLLRTADSAVEVLGRSEDAYPQGQLLHNGVAQPADMGFRTSYDYAPPAMLQDLVHSLAWLWLLAPLALTLWVPGRLLLQALGLDRRYDWGQRTALSVGLSLSFIPLLMTWTTLADLHWGRLSVWAAAILLLGLLLWLGWRDWKKRRRYDPDPSSPDPGRPGALRPCLDPVSLSLGAIFLFTLAVRLMMVRDLAAPPWVDSVHHAMITQLILSLGAFPRSFAPYVDIASANYHMGFHSAAAVFQWLSGLEIDTALLLLGQVLNALAVLAVYFFTTVFVENRTAGVFAALITGLFTPMPAYYTSWGRYTELAGLLVLPVAFGLTFVWLQSERPLRWKWLALACLASAGLFLIHFRVVVFLAALLLAYLVVQTLWALRRRTFRQLLPKQIRGIALTGLGAILLTLPLWPATLSILLLPKLAWGQAGGIQAFSDFSWGYLTSGLGQYTLILAGLGLVWGLVQRQRFPLIMLLWAGLLFFLANLGALSLPGGGLINNTSVEISLFVPLSVLGGYVLGWLVTAWGGLLPVFWRRLSTAALAVVVTALAFLGAGRLLPILNPNTMLFREADRPALTWIAANLPAGETVAINPFAWGYGLYAGNDGGYWMSSLGGHPSLPPPVIYSLSDDPQRVQAISEISRRILELGSQPTALHDYLLEQGIHYVYAGVRGGSLSPQALRYSPFFKTLYARDGAWVFRVLTQP